QVIDTTALDITTFKERVFMGIGSCNAPLSVILSAFGFKPGIPHDSDYVIDVRFLPNPYYVMSLKNKTGEDIEVQEYIKDRFENIDLFLDRMLDFFRFVIPHYKRVGKGNVHITVGCTGGRHRSVAVVEWLKSRLDVEGASVVVRHRDIRLS
ncbi:MAG: RNase adapter RapZ, partial [Dethiosulfovibrio sp.]|nr:RNase adapter RapZ [Dethiosulfovibrio sp.]